MLIVPAPVKVNCALVAPPPRLRVAPEFDVMVTGTLLLREMAELMVAVLLAATVILPLVVPVGFKVSVPPDMV